MWLSGKNRIIFHAQSLVYTRSGLLIHIKKTTVKTRQLVSYIFHYLADLFNTNGTNRNALSKQLETYSNITTTKLITKVEK